MPCPYEALLHGNRIDRTGYAPEEKRAVRVRVAVLEAHAPTGRGERMASALSRPARPKPFPEISDPAAWRRETRKDARFRVGRKSPPVLLDGNIILYTPQPSPSYAGRR